MLLPVLFASSAGCDFFSCKSCSAEENGNTAERVKHSSCHEVCLVLLKNSVTQKSSAATSQALAEMRHVEAEVLLRRLAPVQAASC